VPTLAASQRHQHSKGTDHRDVKASEASTSTRSRPEELECAAAARPPRTVELGFNGRPSLSTDRRVTQLSNHCRLEMAVTDGLVPDDSHGGCEHQHDQ